MLLAKDIFGLGEGTSGFDEGTSGFDTGLFVSIYLRAWIVQMLELGAVPRTLADDLMLLAHGCRALHIF